MPAVRHVLTPEDGLGHGFIMAFVDGETLGGRIVRDERFADARPKLARQCGEILARLHSIPRAVAPNLKRLDAGRAAGAVARLLRRLRLAAAGVRPDVPRGWRPAPRRRRPIRAWCTATFGTAT